MTDIPEKKAKKSRATDNGVEPDQPTLKTDGKSDKFFRLLTLLIITSSTRRKQEEEKKKR
jgi:hypothetical protein